MESHKVYIAESWRTSDCSEKKRKVLKTNIAVNISLLRYKDTTSEYLHGILHVDWNHSVENSEPKFWSRLTGAQHSESSQPCRGLCQLISALAQSGSLASNDFAPDSFQAKGKQKVQLTQLEIEKVVNTWTKENKIKKQHTWKNDYLNLSKQNNPPLHFTSLSSLSGAFK